MPVPTLCWENNSLVIVDQTVLPEIYREIPLDTLEDVWQAIRQLSIRGAPAIGICAAFGILVALRNAACETRDEVLSETNRAADYLATSRPTAVNLFWALDRMRARADSIGKQVSAQKAFELLEREALDVFEEDRAICRAIGDHAAPLIDDNTGVLTHCNAGGLATADYGTALSGMFTAHEQGRAFKVYAGETRPLLQGSRLTVWELMQAGIDVTLICDSMAAQVMREGKIQLVIVGADRIAANGDTANKIGTYGLALLAQAHKIPFYVAAPLSTFDTTIETGDGIPIEQRSGEEVAMGFGKRTAPEGATIYNPAFDTTPEDLISGIITEHGILSAPYGKSIRAIFDRNAGRGDRTT